MSLGSPPLETPPIHGATNGAASQSSPVSAPASVDPSPALDSSAVFQALSSNPRLLAAASVMVERANLARKWGLSFGGKRDLKVALGYYDDKELTTAVYRSFYERGDIAERIVEAYPLATWGDGVDIIEDPDPGMETPFETALMALSDRLDLWATVIQADIMAGLGANGYSAILIGAVGKSETELVKYTTPTPDAVLYLKPLFDVDAKVHKYVTDFDNPRFGQPEIYEVDLGLPDGKSIPGYVPKRKVHWTRIIHVVEGNLGNKVTGKPRLKSVINRLQDIWKLVGGGSEAAWNRMDPGQQWDIDKDYAAAISDADLAQLEETFEEVTHGLKRKYKTVGVDIKELSSGGVTNFGNNVDSTVKLVSGGKGMPWRMIVGSELGELASSQDRQNWIEKVSYRRKWFAVPLIRQIVDRFITYGLLPTPASYDAVWPNTEELNETEKATVAKTRAEANLAQVKAGGGLISTSDEIRLEVYGAGPLEEVTDDNDDTDNGGNVDTDTDTDTVDSELQAALKANTDDGNDNSNRRVVIVGGPRRGKSTVARQLREAGIPTYCGDPKSKVKDPEDDVTYLPEGLDWSASSQYIADSWLTKDGPWCVEGIATVRALRKLAESPDYFNVNLADIEIIVLSSAHPDAEVSDKQESTAKAVMTMWSDISHHFPQAKVLRRNSANRNEPDINRKPVEVARKYRHSKSTDSTGGQRFRVSVHR